MKSSTESIDGVWEALFAERQWGSGVLIIRNGKFLGCDRAYFFQGTVEMSGDGRSLKADVHVEHYAGQTSSIFFKPEEPALIEYDTELSGSYVDADGTVVLSGVVDGNPDLKLTVRLMRLIPGPYVPPPRA